MNGAAVASAEQEIAPSPGAGTAAGEVTIVAHDIGPVGGMERVLAELILGLRRLGYRVVVVARTCDLPAGAGVEFHRVRGPSRPFLLAYPWFLIAGSLALLRHRRGVLQVTGALVLNRADVVHVHYCHQAGPSTPSRSTRLFRAHIWAAGLLSRLGERLCYRIDRSAEFACVSDGVAAETLEHYPELAGRVCTIHNGVDTVRFAPGVRAGEATALRSQLGVTPERLLALFVGGEWERKGLQPAIEALSFAPDWDLAVAGSGDRDGVQERVRALGLDGRVHWLGVSSDIGLLYGLADAFVLPTSYETFSLVTFEAAASGLPVLVTPVNGVRELIDDGRNGFLIDRDAKLIGGRLGELVADPELRSRLGRAARESTLAFGWDRMVRKFQALYERLGARAPA
jgi:glycosyltransferase involved in cell wall biosynthesis